MKRYSLKGALDQGDIRFCLPDSAEGAACAAITSCSETVIQDTEAFGLKTEAPKLLNLTGRENLPTAQLKVGVFISRSWIETNIHLIFYFVTGTGLLYVNCSISLLFSVLVCFVTGSILLVACCF